MSKVSRVSEASKDLAVRMEPRDPAERLAPRVTRVLSAPRATLVQKDLAVSKA